MEKKRRKRDNKMVIKNGDNMEKNGDKNGNKTAKKER